LGLSVFLSKEASLLSGLEVAGLCTFTAEDVTKCPYGLVLIRDTQDHAEIRGVPLKDENLQRALDIADYLVEVATDLPM
jgi:hypothetical protein